MGPKHILSFRVKIDQRIIVMKEYSTKIKDWSLTIRCSLVLYPEHSLQGFTLLKRYSWRILRPQLTELSSSVTSWLITSYPSYCFFFFIAAAFLPLIFFLSCLLLLIFSLSTSFSLLLLLLLLLSISLDYIFSHFLSLFFITSFYM